MLRYQNFQIHIPDHRRCHRRLLGTRYSQRSITISIPGWPRFLRPGPIRLLQAPNKGQLETSDLGNARAVYHGLDSTAMVGRLVSLFVAIERVQYVHELYAKWYEFRVWILGLATPDLWYGLRFRLFCKFWDANDGQWHCIQYA